MCRVSFIIVYFFLLIKMWKTLHIAQDVDQLVKQNLVSRLASSRA